MTPIERLQEAGERVKIARQEFEKLCLSVFPIGCRVQFQNHKGQTEKGTVSGVGTGNYYGTLWIVKDGDVYRTSVGIDVLYFKPEIIKKTESEK